jgi:hypothetical protein
MAYEPKNLRQYFAGKVFFLFSFSFFLEKWHIVVPVAWCLGQTQEDKRGAIRCTAHPKPYPRRLANGRTWISLRGLPAPPLPGFLCYLSSNKEKTKGKEKGPVQCGSVYL